MCGITAIFDRRLSYEGRDASVRNTRHPLAATISGMTRAIRHRGPDAMGTWTSGLAALGCARLSILDLSDAGSQPMTRDGRFWIVYNGEVYNYLELRGELGPKCEFRTDTDTEVILAAYERWGEKCVDRFNGMFAFIIWDDRGKTAFGARDRLGIKPLYYFEDSPAGAIAFASEIRAFQYLAWHREGVNRQRLYDFLLDRVTDHTSETMFDGISQVRPGHKFRWSPERGLEVSVYWKYRPTGHLEDIDRAYSDFRELLEDSVRLRLRSDVPVGCLLSGGLDSSSVFCIARDQARRAGKKISSFSTRIVPRTEENSLIDLVISPEEGRHFEDVPTRDSFESDIHALIDAQEEPFADASMLAHFRLMRLARDAGVKVILGGQGGDEFFDGYYGSIYNYLASLARKGRIWECLQRASGFHKLYGFHRVGMAIEVLADVVPAHFTDFYRKVSFGMRAQWVEPGFFDSCHRSRNIATGNHGDDPYLRYLENVATSWTMPGFLHYEDRNSMYFGVETRLPFLDYRLVEFAGALSPHIKMRDCETKHLIRRSLHDIVPHEILSRHRKEPWPAPLGRWLKEPGGILDEAIDKCDKVPFVKPRYVQALIGKYRKTEGVEQTTDVWRLTCMILWYTSIFRRWTDGNCELPFAGGTGLRGWSGS